MSSQPGKDEARSGAGRTGGGSGSGDSPAGGKPKKAAKPTVAASAAKPRRDEATVEITPAEETKTDLPRVPAEPGGTSGSGPSGDGAGGKAEIPPVEDTPAPAAGSSSGSGSSGPGWTKPAEPAGSVSSRRAESPAGAPETSADRPGPAPGGSARAGAPGAGSGSGGMSRLGAGFAALKNRQRRLGSPSGGRDKQSAGGKGTRQAHLQLARLEPWSVMKFSFVVSAVCFVVLLVAVIVLWTILNALGVFSAITDTVTDLTRHQGETSGGLDAANWFSFIRVVSYTFLVGALNILLITALSTVGSVIYNLAADLVGGIEVTLKEAE